MTLLCEITNWPSGANYLSALHGEAKEVVPLIFGHHIYSFLYDFMSSDKIKISYIHILKGKENETANLFQTILKDYSVELEDCEYAWDIEHWFPPQAKLGNTNLKLKIINMIKSAKFVDLDSINDDDYLCYLPLCGKQLTNLIVNSNANISIYTNGEIAALKQNSFIKLEHSKIKSLQKKLNKLYDDCKTIFSKNLTEAT